MSVGYITLDSSSSHQTRKGIITSSIILMLTVVLVLLVVCFLADSAVLYNSVLLARTKTPSTASTVLLLHGLLGSSRNFAGFARTLYEMLGKEHNIVAMDARNHGRSVALGPMPISYDLMSSDVIGEYINS